MRGEWTIEMIQMLYQMTKLPLQTFAYGMEVFTNALQNLCLVTDQRLDVFVHDIAQTFEGASDDQKHTSSYGIHRTSGGQHIGTLKPLQKKDRNMWDDLGGDDLKIVRYSIIFDKPDEETTLQEEQQDLLDYATDGGSYGGLKIAQFFGDQVNRGKIEKIDQKDYRYVRFVYRVVQRIPKGSANYEKRKVELLREISGKIG